MKKISLTILFIAIISNAFGQNIKGVWKYKKVEYESVDTSFQYNTQPGMLIITKDHYSFAYIRGEEERPVYPLGTKWDDISPDTLKQSFGRYISNSGTYNLKKDSIQFVPYVSLHPAYMQKEKTTNRFMIKGKLLIFIWEGKNEKGKWVGKRTWERVE